MTTSIITLNLTVDPANEVRAGRPAIASCGIALDATTMGQLTESQREELAQGLDNRDGWWSLRGSFTILDSPGVEGLVKLLDKRIAEKDRQKAEIATLAAQREADIVAWLAKAATNPESVIHTVSRCRNGYRIDESQVSVSGHITSDPRVVDASLRVRAICDGRNTLAIAAEEFAAMRRVEVDATKVNAWETAATAFLDEHGTESQQLRYAEGLLPEVELTDAIRAHIFEPFDHLTPYQRIDASDLPHGDDCYEGDPTFRVAPAEDLSEQSFQNLTAVRLVAVPLLGSLGAKVLARRHRGQCKNCRAHGIVRNSAHVTLTYGGRDFTREYAI